MDVPLFRAGARGVLVKEVDHEALADGLMV